MVKAFAYGHLLHPVYKGKISRDLGVEDETLELFVVDNETVVDLPIADDLNQAVVDIDSDDENNYLMCTFYKASPSQSQPQSQSLIPQTPLQAEVARYMSNRDGADRPDKGTQTFDVLGWWSAHGKIVPLMSKAAKKYLAIQAILCASERTLLTFTTQG